MENARNACVFYSRVRSRAGQETKLTIDNLSEYDIWIERVELVVRRSAIVPPGRRVIGGAFRLSRGHSEDDFPLQGTLITANGNHTAPIDMDFYIEILLMARDQRETHLSPTYSVKANQGERWVLEVVTYDTVT